MNSQDIKTLQQLALIYLNCCKPNEKDLYTVTDIVKVFWGDHYSIKSFFLLVKNDDVFISCKIKYDINVGGKAEKAILSMDWCGPTKDWVNVLKHVSYITWKDPNARTTSSYR